MLSGTAAEADNRRRRNGRGEDGRRGSRRCQRRLRDNVPPSRHMTCKREGRCRGSPNGGAACRSVLLMTWRGSVEFAHTVGPHIKARETLLRLLPPRIGMPYDRGELPRFPLPVAGVGSPAGSPFSASAIISKQDAAAKAEGPAAPSCAPRMCALAFRLSPHISYRVPAPAARLAPTQSSSRPNLPLERRPRPGPVMGPSPVHILHRIRDSRHGELALVLFCIISGRRPGWAAGPSSIGPGDGRADH